MESLDEFLSSDGTRLSTSYTGFYDMVCKKSDDDKTKKPFRNSGNVPGNFMKRV